MDIDTTGQTHTDRRLFLVERYWPGVVLDDVALIADRVAVVETARSTARHLGSTLIIAEDSVFCWFVAADAADVVALNHAAGVAFDRVVPVTWIPAVRSQRGDQAR